MKFFIPASAIIGNCLLGKIIENNHCTDSQMDDRAKFLHKLYEVAKVLQRGHF